jgi:hypothetical protein
MAQATERKLWVEPTIRELDIEETHALPGTGADVGGNAFVSVPDLKMSPIGRGLQRPDQCHVGQAGGMACGACAVAF